jgi:hypothetical protein
MDHAGTLHIHGLFIKTLVSEQHGFNREGKMSALIRQLTGADLPRVRRICCTAFGTFLLSPAKDSYDDFIAAR